MVDACLCYSCDRHYLLPTIVSSLQARQNLSRHVADVIVVVVGSFLDPRGAIAKLLADNDVKVRIIDKREIGNSHIMFARMFLDRILEPIYKRIVHIDSDTQITDDLDSLFKVELPSGHLMASPDPLAVRIHEKGAFWTATREYFKSIGIHEHNLGRYVNTGLFGGERNDMAAASRECLDLARRREPLRWSDQDCLNIIVGDRLDLLSLRWNFPSFFMNCGFDSLLPPRVVHYMSNPRPWHGPFQPWGSTAHDIYVEQTKREPDLKPFLHRAATLKSIKYTMQQRVKRVIESRTWTRPSVLTRLAELEKSAVG